MPVDTLPLGTYMIYEVGPIDPATGQWSLESATCGPNTQSVFGVVEAVLTPSQPTVSCSFTDRFEPYAAVALVKDVNDPDNQRSSPLLLTVTCHDPSGATDTSETLTGPVTQSGPFTTGLIRFEQATTCSVSEVQSGAAPGASVTVATTLTRNGTSQSVELPNTFPVAPGDTVLVTVTDTYGAAATTATSPTSSFTPPPKQIAVTGFSAVQIIGTGILAIGIGMLLLLCGLSRASARRRQ
jgi:hypothetical protein